MYIEMKQKGAIEHMRKSGVKYLYVAPVDNILCKLGDPTCVGYFIKNNF
jgi:UDP-N-acetylglucosamine pyrophosphorylase